MKRNILILYIVLSVVLFSSSCSRLIVTVRTADHDKIKEEFKKNEAEALEQRLIKNSFYKDAFFSNSLFNPQELEAKLVTKLKEDLKNENDIQLIISGIRESVFPLILDINNQYDQAIILTNERRFKEALSAYGKVTLLINKLEKTFFNEVDYDPNLTKDFKIDFDLLRSTILVFTESARSNLLGDPFVSYITKDSNIHIWDSEYNRTRSWTAFGNSDIAVVQPENPESYNNNYSIKGVRVDADKLIQSGFDALAQTINVMASAQGIPVEEDSGNNYFAPTLPDEIKNISSKQTELNKLRSLKKAYSDNLMTIIFNKNLDKLKEEKDIKVAIKEIQEAWKEQKSTLSNVESIKD